MLSERKNITSDRITANTSVIHTTTHDAQKTTALHPAQNYLLYMVHRRKLFYFQYKNPALHGA